MGINAVHVPVLHDNTDIKKIVENEIFTRGHLHDNNLKLFYAGDFWSRGTAGNEAACLSGIDVANHVHEVLN